MSHIVQSPDSAHTAEFLSIGEVTNGMRKRFYRPISDGVIAMGDTSDYAVCTFIRSWSYGLPLPTLENGTLDEIPVPMVNEMYRYMAQLMQDMTPDFDPNPDPKSPTSPSGD